MLLTQQQGAEVASATETGIRRGMELLDWWNRVKRPALDPLPAGLPAGAEAASFFSTLTLDGRPSSVMGCAQRAVFERAPGSARPGAAVADWVNANFIQKTHWTNPNGLPGGFLYRVAVARPVGGTAQTVDEELAVDLRDIGSRYEWVTARLDVLDYIKAFRSIGRFDRWLRPLNKETGYMTFHPAFSESPDPVPPGCTELVRFGYAVVPLTVFPTFVAYGPGRFYSAMKQYRILIHENGAVEIRILFVVAPRIDKVMNFRGWDPVFGTVGLLDALTLRQTGIVTRAQDFIGRFGLTHHARVHHALLEGLRPVWTGAA
ncbi:MAG: hypothetical protein JST11_27515 [Acidobacteria bacterium]|nr:hypothetical protein [Acidobacteriota bacterium]